MDEVVHKKMCARYNVDQYVENTKNMSQTQKGRAKFAIQIINLSLDELGYGGNSLPKIFFADDLSVNGIPKAGSFIPKFEHNDGEPALLMDVGNNLAEKTFVDESITELKTSGFTDDQIQKLAMMSIFFEEAFHWVDHTKGLLPGGTGPTGKLEGYENYYDQPHEKRARKFSETMLQKNFELIYNSGKLY